MAEPGLFFAFRDTYSLSAGHDPADGYSFVMAEDIAAALTANGWPCRAFPTWLIRDVNAVFGAPKPPFVLNMNLIPQMNLTMTCAGANGPSPEEVFFYHAWARHLNVPVVNILIDQAFHHVDGIRKHLPMPEVMATATLERSDFPFLEALGVARNRMVHLPWGGPPPDPKLKPFAKRTYDAIFHGGLEEVESEADFSVRVRNLGVPGPCIESLSRAVERVIEEDQTVEAAFRAALAAQGVDPGAFDAEKTGLMLFQADQRARAIRRRAFLLAFVDVAVQFFGKYPADFQRRFPRAVFHGPKTFRDVMEVTRETRMSLCETINWHDNVHPRLTYAIPRGCLPVAEKNARLAGDFTDMENIVFSERCHEGLGEKVKSILADSRRGQAMIDAAMPIYESRYTWRETVRALAPFLPPPGAMVPSEAKPKSGKGKPVKRKSAAKSARVKSARTARSRVSRRRGSLR